MSLSIPARDWFKPAAGAEKLWIGLALLWCFVMSLMMPYWHFRGKQNSRGEAYTVQPAAYMARVEKFIAANKVGERKLSEGNIVPIAEPAPGRYPRAPTARRCSSCRCAPTARKAASCWRARCRSAATRRRRRWRC